MIAREEHWISDFIEADRAWFVDFDVCWWRLCIHHFALHHIHGYTVWFVPFPCPLLALGAAVVLGVTTRATLGRARFVASGPVAGDAIAGYLGEIEWHLGCRTERAQRGNEVRKSFAANKRQSVTSHKSNKPQETTSRIPETSTNNQHQANRE